MLLEVVHPDESTYTEMDGSLLTQLLPPVFEEEGNSDVL
jgi:hypothetical protein